MIATPLGRQLASSAKRFALRAMVYYDGYQQYRLDASACKVERPVLLILAKACYQEKIESFPIKSANELKQLLELQRPTGGLTRYFIGPFVNNQRLVYKIFIDPKHADLIERSKCIMPETMLLTQLAPPGLTCIYMNKQGVNGQAPTLWYLRGPQQRLSVLQGGIIQHEDAARAFLGVSKTSPRQQWGFPEYLTILSKEWWRLPLQWWLVGRTAAVQQARLPWSKLVGAAAVMSLLYAFVSFSYLHVVNASRVTQIQNISSDVTQRLALREGYERNLSKLAALREAGQIEQQQLHAWNIIAFLQINDISANQISANNEYLEFSAEAQSATGVVEQLNNLSGVERIEFISPVRRGRSGELFRLRIDLAAD